MTIISTAGINFALTLTAGILLHIFDSDNSVVNYIVTVFICAYSFFLSYSWAYVTYINNTNIVEVREHFRDPLNIVYY